MSETRQRVKYKSSMFVSKPAAALDMYHESVALQRVSQP